MKKSFRTALLCSVLMLSFGLAPAGAQESVSASDAENSGNLWFIELSGNPTTDGNSLANVRAEKAAFKKAAAAAGISYVERRSFDVLFNGFSVLAGPADRMKLAQLAGVKAMYPVEIIQAPEFDPTYGEAPDLAYAIAITGATVAQNSGSPGAGVKVAVMDTGIDYDHADFGGDGVRRSNSVVFPTSRVVAGFDFVGDASAAATGGPAVPDNYRPFP